MYRFDLVLCLLTNLFSFRGEIGPSSEGGARWTSGGGGESQAPLQLPTTWCSGGLQWHSICFLTSSRVAAGLVLGWDFPWSSPIQLSPNTC